MILNNVPLFHKLGEMPITSDPARLDYGSGIEKKMAKYHKRFGIMFKNGKLERARKRRSGVEGSAIMP